MGNKSVIIALALIFSFGIHSNAQIGGISASKLATLCTETVPFKAIEFEPSFAFSYASHIWDNNSELHPVFSTPDSILVTSGFGFRFSYGAYNNLEIGAAAPVDMSSLSWGAKYHISLSEQYSIGLLAGFNLPLGNETITKNSGKMEHTPSIVSGLVMSYSIIDEKLAVDFDAQYQKHIRNLNEKHKYDIFLNVDIGFYLFNNFQIVAGINYSETKFEATGSNSSLLTFNPGLTIECAENFILVMNAPLDIIGKNNLKSSGFGLALTILID